jgi:hypothetical protein
MLTQGTVSSIRHGEVLCKQELGTAQLVQSGPSAPRAQRGGNRASPSLGKHSYAPDPPCRLVRDKLLVLNRLFCSILTARVAPRVPLHAPIVGVPHAHHMYM